MKEISSSWVWFDEAVLLFLTWVFSFSCCRNIRYNIKHITVEFLFISATKRKLTCVRGDCFYFHVWCYLEWFMTYFQLLCSSLSFSYFCNFLSLVQSFQSMLLQWYFTVILSLEEYDHGIIILFQVSKHWLAFHIETFIESCCFNH